MEVGRPPEGCKVMKAVSRPPGVKTHVCDLNCFLVIWSHLKQFFFALKSPTGANGLSLVRTSLLYLWGVRWTGLGWGVVVG